MGTISATFPPRKPGVAALLSLLFAGGGQIYIGQKRKGWLLIALCCALWFVALGWMVALFGCCDAYLLARKLKSGERIGQWECFWGQAPAGARRNAVAAFFALPQRSYEIAAGGRSAWTVLSAGVLAATALLMLAAPQNAAPAPSDGAQQPLVAPTRPPATPAQEVAATETPRSRGAIKVAVMMPITGIISGMGGGGRDAVLLAIEEWNARGGLLGATIEPVVEDTQCDPDAAKKATARVLDQDKVRFIIGELCSRASIAIAEASRGRSVVQISPASTLPEVTATAGVTREHVFRACFLDSYEGRLAATFAYRSLGARRAFVMVDRSSTYSSALAEAFKAQFAELGGFVAEGPYKAGASDFSAVLEQARNARPDVVLLPDFYNVANLVLQQARARGITAPFLGGSGWSSAELDRVAAEGSFFTDHFSADDPRPAVQAFVRSFKEKHPSANGGAGPDALAALSYDAANLLFRAIAEAGTDDADAVASALEAIRFDGVTGSLTFDAGHNPIKSGAVIQVRDGRLVFHASADPIAGIIPDKGPAPAAAPTATPPLAAATVAPAAAPSPAHSFAGDWRDTQTGTVHTITWQDGRPVVTFILDDDGEVYPVTSQSWQNGVLTWTYSVPSTGYRVTFTTVTVSNDSLECRWSNSAGSSGTETLRRAG